VFGNSFELDGMLDNVGAADKDGTRLTEGQDDGSLDMLGSGDIEGATEGAIERVGPPEVGRSVIVGASDGWLESEG